MITSTLYTVINGSYVTTMYPVVHFMTSWYMDIHPPTNGI